MRFGSLKALLFGSIIAAITNLLFAYLAISENNIFLLAAIIIADNLASGFAGAAFIVYLSLFNIYQVYCYNMPYLVLFNAFFLS